MTLVIVLLGCWLLASLVLGGVYAGIGRARTGCGDDDATSSSGDLPRQKQPVD